MKLKVKEYRQEFVRANIDHGLAHQIRINRERRKYSQKEFGKLCGMKQESISRFEDPSYGGYSINSLVKLANVFDTALIVKFVPFSKLLLDTSDKTELGLYSEEFENENLHERQALLIIRLCDPDTSLEYTEDYNIVSNFKDTSELEDQVTSSNYHLFKVTE